MRTDCRRTQWWSEWHAAKAWEEKAILTSAAAAGALEAHYRRTMQTPDDADIEGRAPNAVPVPAVSSEVMPPPGLPVREQPSSPPPVVPVVLPAQSEVSRNASQCCFCGPFEPARLCCLIVATAALFAASPMEIAGTDPPTTPGTSVDYSPSPASPPGDPVPDDTMLQDLVSPTRRG